ncbi:MAG TPA: hypothetical protein VJ250_09150 [Nitrososphaeraceae archaeon]|nr:hypothetical protein [Nitrososphaeraceae archaeon]HJY15088.1 hypothetical protein [Nitrososphaeraceae archaeon]
MNTKRFTISITTGTVVVLLLIGGTGATNFFLNTAHAQAATLGEPYFIEKGKSTVQREIGPNITLYTFTANGTMNGNIEVTDAGEFLSISIGDDLLFEPGEGVITTKDGSETANYTSMDVGNSTNYQGASVYITNSTGQLSFLNGIMGIYKGEADENGNFELKEWHWK